MIITIIFLSLLGLCVIYYIAAGIIDEIDDKLYNKEKVLYKKYYMAESLEEMDKNRKEQEKFKAKTEKFHNLTAKVATLDSPCLPVMIFISIVFLVLNLANGLILLATYNPRIVKCANERNVSTYTTLVNALSNEDADPNYIVPQVIEWNDNYVTYVNHKDNPWLSWYNNSKEWDGTGYIDITEYEQ